MKTTHLLTVLLSLVIIAAEAQAGEKAAPAGISCDVVGATTRGNILEASTDLNEGRATLLKENVNYLYRVDITPEGTSATLADRLSGRRASFYAEGSFGGSIYLQLDRGRDGEYADPVKAHARTLHCWPRY